MTKQEYHSAKLRLVMLDELLQEFRANTSLDTVIKSLQARCKEYEKKCPTDSH